MVSTGNTGLMYMMFLKSFALQRKMKDCNVCQKAASSDTNLSSLLLSSKNWTPTKYIT